MANRGAPRILATVHIAATRIGDGPIIHPGLDSSIGRNINGPSVIRVPSWVREPLGRYYLYFADHKGSYIRLAFADAPAGPWTIHPPGALRLRDTPFLHEAPEVPAGVDAEAIAAPRAPGVPSLLDDCRIPHIASPEVVAADSERELRLYYHRLDSFGSQVTRVATSSDGLQWTARDEILGNPYLRVFTFDGIWYAIAMPGAFYRSTDGLREFEAGPVLYEPNMRHAAVWIRDERLFVFWTRVHDNPERIWLSEIGLHEDWTTWRESEPIEVLRPERPWEGDECSPEPSRRSSVDHLVCQLRDPAILVDGDDVFLAYVGGGERAIGLASLEFSRSDR